MSAEVRAGRRSFAACFAGALRLDASVFEEVEHDRGALPQAAGVVALAICALSLGPLSVSLSALVHAVAIAALVLAVRQALDTDTTRALLVCVAAMGFGLVLLLLIGSLLWERSAA